MVFMRDKARCLVAFRMMQEHFPIARLYTDESELVSLHGMALTRDAKKELCSSRRNNT